jgi:hypothetical protein
MALDRNANTPQRVRKALQRIPTVVFNETPAGTIDGVNATFTLIFTPVTGTLMVFVNGTMKLEGTNFTVSGKTITFAGGSVPALGVWLRVTYSRK